MITFAQLQTLLAVARLGSLTEAARELGTTQPTVSLQLRALGREVGESLVERYGKGVRLTAAGTATQAYALELINGLRALQEKVTGLRGGVIGSLSVGASATLGGYLLPPILSRFRQLFPEVEIRLQVDSPEHIFRDLLANTLDLVFSIEVEIPKGLVAEAPSRRRTGDHRFITPSAGKKDAGYARGSFLAAAGDLSQRRSLS